MPRVLTETFREESRLVNSVSDYAPRPEYRPLTKFEQRGLRLGHGVWDIVFQESLIKLPAVFLYRPEVVLKRLLSARSTWNFRPSVLCRLNRITPLRGSSLHQPVFFNMIRSLHSSRVKSTKNKHSSIIINFTLDDGHHGDGWQRWCLRNYYQNTQVDGSYNFTIYASEMFDGGAINRVNMSIDFLWKNLPGRGTSGFTIQTK